MFETIILYNVVVTHSP